jgi:hypothetical protein
VEPVAWLRNLLEAIQELDSIHELGKESPRMPQLCNEGYGAKQAGLCKEEQTRTTGGCRVISEDDDPYSMSSRPSSS